MLQPSYELHQFLSNSRAVLAGLNQAASTFPLKLRKNAIFSTFLHVGESGTKGQRMKRKR
jgi:hypothetical protein